MAGHKGMRTTRQVYACNQGRLLAQLGMTTKNIAILLGVKENTVRSWRCGVRRMPDMRRDQIKMIVERLNFQRWQLRAECKRIEGEYEVETAREFFDAELENQGGEPC